MGWTRCVAIKEVRHHQFLDVLVRDNNIYEHLGIIKVVRYIIKFWGGERNWDRQTGVERLGDNLVCHFWSAVNYLIFLERQKETFLSASYVPENV